METINELARETPIIHRTEVLVVGSGPGGLQRMQKGIKRKKLLL